MIQGLLNFGEFNAEPVRKFMEFKNPNNKQQTFFYQLHEKHGNSDGIFIDDDDVCMLTMFVYEPRNPAFGVREVHTERMVRKGSKGYNELERQAKRKRDDANNPPHLGLL